MQITNDFGDKYGASQVCVTMVKTLVVKVYLDVRGLPGNEVSEEEIELMAHENWLEAQWGALAAIGARFPYIDMEFLSTDNVEMEVIE
jgi:hypothetical protein